MSIDQKRDYLRRPWNVDVPLPQLLGLFNSTIVGEDVVEGRPAIIIESTPRPDAHPGDEEERRALHKRVKLWSTAKTSSPAASRPPLWPMTR